MKLIIGTKKKREPPGVTSEVTAVGSAFSADVTIAARAMREYRMPSLALS